MQYREEIEKKIIEIEIGINRLEKKLKKNRWNTRKIDGIQDKRIIRHCRRLVGHSNGLRSIYYEARTETSTRRTSSSAFIDDDTGRCI